MSRRTHSGRPENRRLYWTDNHAKRVYSVDPASRAVETVVEGHQVNAFTFQTDGSLLLFGEHTRVSSARDGEVRTIIDGLPGEEEHRFNDVLADPVGRVICGTAPGGSQEAALYSIALDATVTKLIGGLSQPVGMGFTPGDDGLYVAEMRGKRITLFDYDIATGSLTNGRPYLDPSNTEGSPDGITVDAEGYVWVVLSRDWAVARFDPSGSLVQRIDLPARKVTGLTFGGDDLETMFITSSSRVSVPGEEVGPEGGALFAVSPGVGGRLDHRSAIHP